MTGLVTLGKNYCLFSDMRFCSYFDNFIHWFQFINQGKLVKSSYSHMWQKMIIFWSGIVFLGDLS
jgi:hypothetical protein